ncbi:MAG TPA: hypothetical protein VMI94_09495 [Bryobacteraceae bacterium]|nr:hypothetical protein [Bryobacteraceae bacterium]
MKWAVPLFLCLNLAAAELAPGRTVFLMSMSHGLDQFVANRLTRMHVLQVVTDPAKADTIITDQVGKPFEDRLKALLPPPPEPEQKKAEEKKPETKPTEKGDTPPGAGLASMLSDAAHKSQGPGSMSTYGRGRGTIFLVDVKSHQVLWSVFEAPDGYSPHELDRRAERIVKRLKEDLTPKEEKKK